MRLNLYILYCQQKEIEAGGKHLCSVVYGSLPPTTRTRQVSPLFFFIYLLIISETLPIFHPFTLSYLHLCQLFF